MPRDLGQANQIVVVVGQVLVGHCMPKEARVDLHAGHGCVFIDDGPDASVAKRAAFADEDAVRGKRGPRLQVGLDSTPRLCRLKCRRERKPLHAAARLFLRRQALQPDAQGHSLLNRMRKGDGEICKAALQISRMRSAERTLGRVDVALPSGLLRGRVGANVGRCARIRTSLPDPLVQNHSSGE